MRLMVVDGLDGVGKDTHAWLIKEYYERQGLRVLLRSHPSVDTVFGRQAKRALLGVGKINKVRAAVFYALDVLQSLRRYCYRSAERYDVVIMVRYLMGTAYLPARLSRVAYRVFVKFVPTSEYMFFLDAPAEVLLARVGIRAHKEIFETLDSLVCVRKKALSLVQQWYIVDTSESIAETHGRIIRILEQLDGAE